MLYMFHWSLKLGWRQYKGGSDRYGVRSVWGGDGVCDVWLWNEVSLEDGNWW